MKGWTHKINVRGVEVSNTRNLMAGMKNSNAIVKSISNLKCLYIKHMGIYGIRLHWLVSKTQHYSQITRSSMYVNVRYMAYETQSSSQGNSRWRWRKSTQIVIVYALSQGIHTITASIGLVTRRHGNHYSRLKLLLTFSPWHNTLTLYI